MFARQLPRLLASDDATGSLSLPATSILAELEASGLRGRGGAGFPTARKVQLLNEQRSHHKIVVVNAMESEPASHKDTTLLAANPHLVLDGAEALALSIGALDIVVCVARDNTAAIQHVRDALGEREHRGAHRRVIRLETPPGRYVAGEESALVHWLDDNESLPQYRPRRPHILKVGRRPVLVDNAETCANVALIARHGAQWFRSLGTSGDPGSTLVTLSGAVERPVVLEIELGTPLHEVLRAGRAAVDIRAVLLGGYGGAWLDGSLLEVPYANESLRAEGASVGAGVVVVLGTEGCGLLETQRIVRWMANESARQCGPCAFGLPALAEDLGLLVSATAPATRALERLSSRAAAIAERGACHHPDGVVQLVRSALHVFAEDALAHARGRACAGALSAHHVVAVPRLETGNELAWL